MSTSAAGCERPASVQVRAGRAAKPMERKRSFRHGLETVESSASRIRILIHVLGVHPHNAILESVRRERWRLGSLAESEAAEHLPAARGRGEPRGRRLLARPRREGRAVDAIDDPRLVRSRIVGPGLKLFNKHLVGLLPLWLERVGIVVQARVEDEGLVAVQLVPQVLDVHFLDGDPLGNSLPPRCQCVGNRQRLHGGVGLVRRVGQLHVPDPAVGRRHVDAGGLRCPLESHQERGDCIPVALEQVSQQALRVASTALEQQLLQVRRSQRDARRRPRVVVPDRLLHLGCPWHGRRLRAHLHPLAASFPVAKESFPLAAHAQSGLLLEFICIQVQLCEA
mmetsp:Transcript_6598/g.25466  ORF Transcript_6598/g.25466 Transcript_6598/m.25466 type:complete len:338 (-) Transcript_6598:288-1301(-)